MIGVAMENKNRGQQRQPTRRGRSSRQSTTTMKMHMMKWFLLVVLLSPDQVRCIDAFDKKFTQPRFLKRTREMMSTFEEDRLERKDQSIEDDQTEEEEESGKLVKKIWRFSRRRGVLAVGGVRAISSLRAGSAQLGGIDRRARSLTLFMGWVVGAQAIGTAIHTHRDRLYELASRLMSHETIAAAKTIRSILASVDDHGVVDVFSKYPTQDLLASVFALSRIQSACRHYEKSNLERGIDDDGDSDTSLPDEDLLDDLLYYAPFASAAYGWKMDLATAGRLHRGDRNALVKMTGVELEDIVSVSWEARTNRPAYYIVRDKQRKRIVLSIRGTWSAHDVLTDLCCTPEEYFVGRRLHKAHNGMLAAARGVSSMAEDIIAKELEENPGYSLLLVGHSMGGSVAAILGNMWEEKFPGTTVYAYGPACVSPENERGGCRVVSVLVDGDPFSSLSLGHVGDVSCALSYLCENDALRSTILMRTDGPVEKLEDRDLEWCAEAMAEIREQMVGEKLFPPGLLLFVSQASKSRHSSTIIREVPTNFFRDLRVGPRMFDLSRHIPRLYEARLRQCQQHS